MDEVLRYERARTARVGRLATVSPAGRPHIVPCCFAIDGAAIYTAVDDVKPKSTVDLRRLENVRAEPAVALLVDHYEEEWSALWWIRIDGRAHVAAPSSEDHATACRLLVDKYEQYRRQPPAGPAIVIEIERWRAWP